MQMHTSWYWQHSARSFTNALRRAFLNLDWIKTSNSSQLIFWKQPSLGENVHAKIQQGYKEEPSKKHLDGLKSPLASFPLLGAQRNVKVNFWKTWQSYLKLSKGRWKNVIISGKKPCNQPKWQPRSNRQLSQSAEIGFNKERCQHLFTVFKRFKTIYHAVEENETDISGNPEQAHKVKHTPVSFARGKRQTWHARTMRSHHYLGRCGWYPSILRCS